MSEKTWLHWSLGCFKSVYIFHFPYHVWKDMAPLKRGHAKRYEKR